MLFKTSRYEEILKAGFFLFVLFFLVIASALEPVSALSFVSLSVRLLSGRILL